MSGAAIEFSGVTLIRRTQQELHYDLKRSLLNALSGRRRAPVRRKVIDGVRFRIEHGEKVGLIGANGSGKSTLLKLIAGILKPTSGTISIEGSIAPLIELGVGFDPELSLVENVVYYGVLLGHPEPLVRAHIEEILDFAELQPHRDEPTKTLSSGMSARLSFAIATEFRPDVLLVDEVLSVGDERFRRKCAARIDRFWTEASTIVLVSHDMQSVARMCERILWLDDGAVRYDGPADLASRRYLATVPAVLTFERGEELIALADTAERGEVLVRGTSGSEQIFIIRGGRRHPVATVEWFNRAGYSGDDVRTVEDEVILEIPEGEILA